MVCLLCAVWPAKGEQVTITGTVIGAEREALGECRVLVRSRDYDRRWTWPTAQTNTDGQGRFSCALEPRHLRRPVQVAAVKEGMAIGWTRAAAGDEIAVQLGAAPVACAGSVSDADGNPIAGAQVWVHQLSRPFGHDLPREYLYLGQVKFLSATTDEVGAFEIGNLPPGGVIGIAAVAEGFECLTIAREIAAERRDIRLVLQPEASISGTVTRAGQAVGGVRVLARSKADEDRQVEALSGADGSYWFGHLSPGSYTVRTELNEQFAAEVLHGIAVEAGQHVTDADIQLFAGGLLQGAVREAETGRSLVGVSVAVRWPRPSEPGYAWTIVSSDPAGRYAFRLPPGEAKVSYWPYDVGYEGGDPASHTVHIVEGETLSGLDIVLKPYPSISGRVLGPDGKPVAGAQLAPVSEWYIGPLEVYLRAQSDDEGHFEMSVGRDPREEIVFAVFGRHLGRGLAGIAVMEDPDEPLEVRLSRGAYAVTDVVDPQGNPLPGTPVGLSMICRGPNGWHFISTSSDEQGCARFGPLAPGVSVELRPAPNTRRRLLDPMSLWRDLGEVTLAPGQEYTLPPLQLNPQGRSLEGWVLDGDHRPIPGALIHAAQHRGLAFADEQGHFELAGLPVKGKVWLTATHPIQPLWAAEEVDPDWDIEPSLVLRPTGSIKGRIVDREGNPVAGAWVRHRHHVYMPSSWELRKRRNAQGARWGVRTDEEGRWQIDGLVPGAECMFMVEEPGSNVASGLEPVIVKSGETIDLGDRLLREPKIPGPGGRQIKPD